MLKTIERSKKYYGEEEFELDLTSAESIEKDFQKVSTDSYIRGELAALIWLSETKSLSHRGIVHLKWRMESLMDCLDGKLSYETLLPAPKFRD